MSLETTAQLENEAIHAMTELVSEHGYSREDLCGLVDVAMENAS